MPRPNHPALAEAEREWQRLELLLRREAALFERLMQRRAAVLQRDVRRFPDRIRSHESAMNRLAAAFQRRIKRLTGAPDVPPKPPYQEPTRRSPRPRRPRPDAGGVLVRPDRPLNLSGGAAAPLEFDD